MDGILLIGTTAAENDSPFPARLRAIDPRWSKSVHDFGARYARGRAQDPTIRLNATYSFIPELDQLSPLLRRRR